jgi:hypothetical protein
MRVFVEASLRQDEAYTVDDLSSACLWFPPGWEMSEAESVSFEQEVRAAAGEYAESGPLTIVDLMERVHPTAPHFYLAFAGTRPDRQAGASARCSSRLYSTAATRKTYLPTLKPAPNATAASMNVSGSVFRAGSTCQMVLHCGGCGANRDDRPVRIHPQTEIVRT